MDNLFNVGGKTIIVTGGGGVLCGTMAKALAAAGAKVAVLDINEQAAVNTVEQIKKGNGQALAIPVVV